MLLRRPRDGEHVGRATSGRPRRRTARRPPSANSGRAQSHAVPPSTFTSPDCSAARASSLSLNVLGWRPLVGVFSVALVPEPQRRGPSPARLRDVLEQVPDHLVARRGDADLPARPYERADHLGAAVGLPRARRTLDRQDRARRDRRRCEPRTGPRTRRRAGANIARSQRRRRRQQQAMGRGVLRRPVGSNAAPVGHATREAIDRLLEDAGVDVREREGRRTRGGRPACAPSSRRGSARCDRPRPPRPTSRRPSASARARAGSPSPGPGSDTGPRRTPSAFRS